MPIAGFVRLRKSQIGKQTVLGTAVAATRRLPWRGIIAYNPNRTDPDVDTGTLDPAINPYPMAPETTWDPTGLLTYDDLPYRLAGALLGGVTPTGNAGTGYTWTYAAASVSADAFEYFTVETADDTAATDGIRGTGGVINTFSEEMTEDLGPWNFTDNWLFAKADLAQDITAGLAVDDTPNYVFGAHTELWVDADPAGIGTTWWTDALHAASLTITNNLDQKRFANGANASNTAFRLAGYGRGAREIELVLTVAKTAQTMAEAATLDDDPVPQRFIQITSTSVENITGAIKYSYRRRGCFTLRSRAEGEIGGNATIVLTYRAQYNTTLGYGFQAIVKNGLAAL
jgi:hypothetical protein